MAKTLTITKSITKTKKEEKESAKSILDDILEKTERESSNKIKGHQKKFKRLQAGK